MTQRNALSCKQKKTTEKSDPKNSHTDAQIFLLNFSSLFFSSTFSLSFLVRRRREEGRVHALELVRLRPVLHLKFRPALGLLRGGSQRRPLAVEEEDVPEVGEGRGGWGGKKRKKRVVADRKFSFAREGTKKLQTFHSPVQPFGWRRRHPGAQLAPAGRVGPRGVNDQMVEPRGLLILSVFLGFFFVSL